jgi:hypothetical protein
VKRKVHDMANRIGSGSWERHEIMGELLRLGISKAFSGIDTHTQKAQIALKQDAVNLYRVFLLGAGNADR